MDKYDVIVIGAGHAGIEAALASSRLGCKTLLVTLSKGTIGLMSCNPAIGGVGKGQLVKEIDALGGEMAKVTDRTYLQIRTLNRSKGPAVQALRAQSDKKLYSRTMRKVLEAQDNLKIKQATVEKILLDNHKAVISIITDDYPFYQIFDKKYDFLTIYYNDVRTGTLMLGRKNIPEKLLKEPPPLVS